MRGVDSVVRSLRRRGPRSPRQQPLVELQDVSVQGYYGMRHVSLSVGVEDVLAVVGDPGPAQHTFLQLLAGGLVPDDGTVERPGRSRVACSWLSPEFPDASKVEELVSRPAVTTFAADAAQRPGGHEALAADRIEATLKGLGGPGVHRDVRDLGEADRHRVSLAAALLADAELVILENPTRHLDIAAIDWLGGHIAASTQSWVVASHDRALIDLVAGRIAVIEHGVVTVHAGNFTELLRARPAPGADAVPDTSPADRINDYPERQQAAEHRSYDFSVVEIPPGPRLTDRVVVTAAEVTKLRAHRPVVNDFSIQIERGAIVGVIGPRGCGKTTLLELLARRSDPDSGSVTTSDSTRVAYVAASDLRRFGDTTVSNVIGGSRPFTTIGAREVSSRALLEAFGFRGRRQLCEGANLTSAERDRLRLALTVSQGGNVLVLDDPTGGMEIDMLSALEDALLAFPGTVIISTHDRWLLERVATHIVAPAPGPVVGGWEVHQGGYSSYATLASTRARP